MTSTPSDTLRAAATKLRGLATAASTDTDGTPTTRWSTTPLHSGYSSLHGDVQTLDDGRVVASPRLLHGGDMRRPVRMRTQHAEYAATMDPTVGLALADWLETSADYCTPGPTHPTHVVRALAVAQRVLGEDEAVVAAQPVAVPYPTSLIWTVEAQCDGDTGWVEWGHHNTSEAAHKLAAKFRKTRPAAAIRVVRQVVTTTVEPTVPDATAEEPPLAPDRSPAPCIACMTDESHDPA
ncbi:hypothetical protein [Streptomyces sp. NPDC060184]|uniref:hypothetical protein n=1 Tax=Streptomyces sp. NPDC060184 TaxID=3347064 RepID=UPI00366737DC